MIEFSGKTVAVTGGANGIGASLVAGFEAAGAKVAVLDVNSVDDRKYVYCDVSKETELQIAINNIENDLGPIDIFVSNAGVMSAQGESAASASDLDWARCWSINVMAHVYAARLLLPSMIARGSGYFVNVASAAGLLNQIGDAAYSATKHAAVSFAESLAITHRSDGIGVSVVCPQYVATGMIGLSANAAKQSGSLLTADQVASLTLDAVRRQEFLVLPHPKVALFAQQRSEDHDRWINGMTGLRQRSVDRFGDAHPERFYLLV